MVGGEYFAGNARGFCNGKSVAAPATPSEDPIAWATREGSNLGSSNGILDLHNSDRDHTTEVIAIWTAIRT